MKVTLRLFESYGEWLQHTFEAKGSARWPTSASDAIKRSVDALTKQHRGMYLSPPTRITQADGFYRVESRDKRNPDALMWSVTWQLGADPYDLLIQSISGATEQALMQEVATFNRTVQHTDLGVTA